MPDGVHSPIVTFCARFIPINLYFSLMPVTLLPKNRALLIHFENKTRIQVASKVIIRSMLENIQPLFPSSFVLALSQMSAAMI